MKRDAHIHSPYCPHGTADTFESYIEKAIQLGIEDITFTEHAPLPKGFIDPTPYKDSGMNPDDVMPYITELQQLREQYKDSIRIRIGFEVDYIVGFEEETAQWLETYGKYIDDSILSVHFLLHEDEYVCIDYSEEVFLQFANRIGSTQKLYNLYYNTVKASIISNLGRFKPIRIGHPTLIHKFQLAHKQEIDDAQQIEDILIMMSEQKLELDVNSAGYAKKFCKEPYPPLPYLKRAQALKIPFIFGSDAHQAKDLHQHSEKLASFFQ